MTALQTVRAVDLIEEPEPLRDGLVGDLIGGVGLFLIGGDPKSFKTMLGLQLAIAVASRPVGDVLGRPVLHGPVLFVEEEGSRSKLRARILLMCRGLGVDPPEDLHLSIHRGVRLDDQTSVKALYEAASAIRPRLIVMDPLVYLHSGDENKASDMSRVMRPLNAMAARLECAVIVIHHLNKPPQDGRKPARLAQRLRGSSAFAGAMDGVLIIDRDGDRTARARGEYRDGEPIELYLELDPTTLLLELADPPESARKAMPQEVVAFVVERGYVGVTQVAEHFGVTRVTARNRLEECAAAGLIDRAETGKNRGVNYMAQVVSRATDHALTTDHGGDSGGQSPLPIGRVLTTDHPLEEVVTNGSAA